MKDYEALQRKMWQAVLASDKKLDAFTKAFFNDFIEQLRKNNYVVDKKTKRALSQYYKDLTVFLEQNIATAASLATDLPMNSPEILSAMKSAFTERWDDGSILSQRLWQHERITAKNVEATIRASIAQGKSNSKILYEIQYAIESNAANKFEVISNNRNKWTSELKDKARFVINNPAGKADYYAVVKKTEDYIKKLSSNGTKAASEQLLKSIEAAVKKGSADAVDNALKWWLYDKQLYNAKRIARTEMATAAHNAVINTTIEDPLIIGYLWRLSAGHKDTGCLCNINASVNMGLGLGVWTKETVPRKKPHPHCMCSLIPVVTKQPDFVRIV